MLTTKGSIASRRRVLAGGAALAGALGAPALAGAQARPVRIGLLHPVTGFVAYSGAQGRLGGQMAIDEINAAGGIRSMGGARLEAVLGDTQAKVEVGVAEVEKMNEAGVAAIVGCFQSAVVLATTQAAAKYGIPYAVDVGASDLITTRGL
ncbi:MAG: ABC transporter substrate-binding protein, partial [Alphaproteobacteria bacterium]